MTKARKGLNAGGKCYGYDNLPVHFGDRRDHVEYQINEAQAEVVREVFRLYADHQGLRTIAKHLNARHIPSPRAGKRGTGSWSPSVIRSMLRNEKYRGIFVWGQTQKTYKGGTKVRVRRKKCDWIRIEVPDLRIVSDQLWTAAHACIPTRDHQTGHGKASGRKPKYMMSQLARCSACGGPMKVTNGKHGKKIIKVYTCSWHKERGPEVCDNTLRRPVESVNKAVIGWIRSHLTEEVILVALRETRRRLEEQHRAVSTDIAKLEREATQLRAEIDRLVAAVAAGQGAPDALVKGISDRQARLAEVEGRIRTAKTAPEAINLELRRLEAEARKRLSDLAGVFERNPEEARAALRELFPDRLVFTPVETPDGPRFQVEGDAVVGRFLVAEGRLPNVASPTGFEPVLQP